MAVAMSKHHCIRLVERNMPSIKPAPLRNKIDLADALQCRAWTRRFGIPIEELRVIVAKVGNSATGVAKEIQLQRSISSGNTQI